MKTRKIYELVGMDACRFSITYMRIQVNLEFKDGNTANNVNASLSTDNPFIQDAIENDKRFKGGKIILRYTSVIKEDDDVEEPSGDDSFKEPIAEPSEEGVIKAPSKPKKSAKAVKSDIVPHEEIRNINDAMAFFASKGEMLDNEEQIEFLKEKYKVSFPNLQ